MKCLTSSHLHAATNTDKLSTQSSIKLSQCLKLMQKCNQQLSQTFENLLVFRVANQIIGYCTLL